MTYRELINILSNLNEDLLDEEVSVSAPNKYGSHWQYSLKNEVEATQDDAYLNIPEDKCPGSYR